MRERPRRPSRAVVVANGAIANLAPLDPLLADADLVVAADGGARLLLAQGRRPHVVVGDMDSLPAPMLDAWHAGGGETVVFPPAKDETDLELALTYAVEQGAARIAILGALGGRVDHQTANLLLLAAPAWRDLDMAIVDAGTRIVAIHDRVELEGQPGDLLSLLPLTASVDGIVTTGLEYPLRGESLALGPARGVSNVFVQPRAGVRIGAGVLLAIHTWSDDRPLGW
jgi:thiamine pyrophosphokinase